MFSRLTHQEEHDLNLANEQAEVTAHGMTFLSFPIPDREVPDSESRLARALEELEEELSRGRNVALHCRQGIGRAGLVAACLFLTKGIAPEAAVQRLITTFEKWSTEVIKLSLTPGQVHCLKTRPDGTILDGITECMSFVLERLT